jgi:hypothetical protein
VIHRCIGEVENTTATIPYIVYPGPPSSVS